MQVAGRHAIGACAGTSVEGNLGYIGMGVDGTFEGALCFGFCSDLEFSLHTLKLSYRFIQVLYNHVSEH
jgi:hypothetical protein